MPGTGRLLALLTILCPLLIALPAQGQSITETRLTIGTKEAPPFAMKGEDGTWRGISIELWRAVAEELGLSYEFEERTLEGLLDGVADGSLDAAIAAITITPEREETIDFSHPFFTTGLGIAVPKGGGAAWWAVLRQAFSIEFLQVVASLALVLLVAGLLLWLFERRRNADQFESGIRGVGSAFWWSAVTMTTVGYGDKAPVTLGGRIVALVWMFTAVIIISSFTASIASSLTVNQLGGMVEGLEDLPTVRTGAAGPSTATAFLTEAGISFRAYDTPEAGLADLASGRVEAFVYDVPILQYIARSKFQGEIDVLSETLDRQDYGVALPFDSPLREPVNLAILRYIGTPAWDNLRTRYLGRDN